MTPRDESADLDRLAQQVLAASKYRHVAETVIRTIGQRELRAGRSLKEAIKATKNKLHQVGGAYQTAKPNYATWLAQLTEAAQTGNPNDFKVACREVMRHHASTRERLPILDDFFAVTLADLPPIRSVLDVACGLNPLACFWMPLAEGCAYFACDIYGDMVGFVNDFLALTGIPGEANVCDLLTAPPPRQVDVALALKVLPPLEQVDKTAGLNLLRALKANYLLVSFPAHSLGGRDKGMGQNYEARFRRLIEGEGWAAQRFSFPTELAFLLQKG